MKREELIKGIKETAYLEGDFDKVLNTRNYIGRAPQQVDEFTRNIVTSVRGKY